MPLTTPSVYPQSTSLPGGFYPSSGKSPKSADTAFMPLPEKGIQATAAMNSVMSSSAMGDFMIHDIKEQIDFSTKLFLTQLQNQIPGDETDTNEMVRTLMGMMQATQQVKTNMLMEDQNVLGRQLHSLEMARLQGRMAEYEGDTFSYDGNGSNQEFFATLPGGVAQAVMLIRNGDSIVQKIMIDPKAGRQKVIWDGTDSNGDSVDSGVYQADLYAMDGHGTRSVSKLSIVAPITSVMFDENHNKAYFMNGDVKIDSVDRFHRKYQQMQSRVPLVMEQATQTGLDL